MDTTLGYLREILSNYTDKHAISREIYKKLESKLDDEISFVRSLDQEQTQFLNDILPQEIEHALDEQDFPRTSELNHIYELLI
ncbi:sporulation protein [Bacillus suaedaesalsae]|uniref:Sporulation protein n=1 Tax=Bacillus suaedaesalsae TaxID=2810349 RepID=A0ABS2DMT1_9BACI|nr:sporulation protein [Bacillus suaedaesalsae]MBM6619809.1 sporulation protein [Bacillus suaedaesalsae]